MGADGQKMSKRWGNVINPDEIVAEFGADALRVYEMFMGPFDQAAAWSTNGLAGARKFLERISNLKISPTTSPASLKNILHKTIKKVGIDIEEFKFNTAVSALMILVNEIYGQANGELELGDYKLFLQILAPLAPHLAEELWASSGQSVSIFKEAWPSFDPELIKDESINLVVQINGKMRTTISVAADINEDEAKKIALENEITCKWTADKKIIKVIFVRGKLINIVIQ